MTPTILAIAFAAFCVWLTVRIVNRRERWAKWMLAGVIGLPVLYVASFRPACWAVRNGQLSRETAALMYSPVIARDMPRFAVRAALWYGECDEDGTPTYVRLRAHKYRKNWETSFP